MNRESTMTETTQSETKVCKLCAETIKSAAVVCPHCRQVQTTWKLCSPNVTGAVTLTFFAIGILCVFLFITKIVGRQDFEPYQSQLTILESTVSQRVTTNATFVVITGVLTNGSDYSWKNISLEGQLYSSDGHLMDVIPAVSVGYYDGVVAPAHSVAAFKIESRTSRSLTDYSNHKVIVQWARDATSWP